MTFQSFAIGPGSAPNGDGARTPRPRESIPAPATRTRRPRSSAEEWGTKAILAIVILCSAGCSGLRQSRSHANLLPLLRPYVNEVVNELGMISGERKVVLDEIAASIATQLKAGKPA